MKKLILIGCLSYMNLALADCDASMKEGHQQASSGNTASSMASESLKHFQQLIADKADDSIICDAGKDTRMKTYLTGIKYKHARLAFVSAINTCSAPYDAEAASNANSMTSAYNASLDLVKKYDGILGAQCGALPTAPLLNNAK